MYFSIDCGADCTPLNLPALPGTTCEVLNPSEIFALIVEGTAPGPADATLGADWATKIDQADTTGAKMKVLFGVGSIAEPERTSRTTARFKPQTSSVVRVLTFTIYSVADPLVYNFLRTLQCGKSAPRVYAVNMAGNMLYQKMPTTTPDTGIPVLAWDVSFPYDEGREGVERAVVKITFENNLTDPDKAKIPIDLSQYIS